jgi:hypothetical protein
LAGHNEQCFKWSNEESPMSVLNDDIAAFERMRTTLEAEHDHEWALFHGGAYVGTFKDFETAAEVALERFDVGPYLIRQIGAPPVQLPGGMIFTPAHSFGPGGF